MPVLPLSSFSSIFSFIFLFFTLATEQKVKYLKCKSTKWCIFCWFLPLKLCNFFFSTFKSVMTLQDMEYIIHCQGIELQMRVRQDAYPKLYEPLEQSSLERSPLPFYSTVLKKAELSYGSTWFDILYQVYQVGSHL